MLRTAAGCCIRGGVRILAIKLSSLGDVFHPLPAIHSIRLSLDATVDWVTNDHYVSLVQCFDDVERVIGFPRADFFRQHRPFLKELRAEEYDLVLDFQGLLKSALVARAARARVRIGPSFHREGSHIFYTAVAGCRDKSRHAVEEAMDFARHLAVPCLPPAFPVHFPEVHRDEPHPRIVVAPSSRWVTKNWPLARFADTIRRIRGVRDVSVYLVGGPGDRSACDEIASAVGTPCTNLAGSLSLPETGGLLAASELLIANDSGPVHMAAAIGTPALVIFGPTEPTRTGPYGDRHRVVRDETTCGPCFSRTCAKGRIACLEAVTPERVAALALEMLPC